jgi:MscS family membrane protein
MVVTVTWIILRVIDFFGLVLSHRAAANESKTDDQIVPFIKDAAKVLISIFSLFFILGAIFQLNVASLIAGLGIGGLAVALAAKESLENLLGSFTIFLDKPFTVGDLIKVGSLEGTVEKIGFRSTRIRTAEKSYVTVPNKKMVDSELDNLSMRMQRLVKFNMALSYGTKTEQVKKILHDIKTYLDNNSIIIKDETIIRLHNFNETGINILVSYFVDTLEYKVYLNVREEINFKIMEIVEIHGSNFAHTTLDMLINKKAE